MGSNWQNRGSGFDWASCAQNSGSGEPSAGRYRRNTNARVEYDAGGNPFSDFFSSIFGDAPREGTTSSDKSPIRGRDTELEVTISLEEAYHGTTRQITRGNQQFTAHIPRGARTGTKVRFANQGERGFAGGTRGDLYLVINIEDHPLYERDEDDLTLDAKIPLYDAVLGGEVRISTLAGDLKLRIPAGTQSGQRIRLNGKGMPNIRNKDQHGDLYVRVMVQVPTDLSGKELELFEQLRDLRSKGV